MGKKFMNRNRDFIKPIVDLAKEIDSLNRRALKEYEPIVDNIVKSNCQDSNEIEYVLDRLIDFCGYKPALNLYKKLCRHYSKIDRVAATHHINFIKKP